MYVDCDVLTADGGTRCASITGGFVALALAVRRLQDEGKLAASPLTGTVAAVSCGVVDGTALLDLDYAEDSTAEVDANVVMTGEGGLVEVQATAERTPLSRAHLDELLALGGARHRRPARRADGRHRVGGRRAAGARHPQRPQAARVPPPAARRGAGAAAGRASCSRPRTATRSPPTRWARRAPPRRRSGGRRSPTTRAWRPPRSAARPGVRSARFAGAGASDADNLARLLRRRRRPARRCATCASSPTSTPGGEEHCFTGTCEGTLAAAPRGAGGFGYDPAFLPADVADGRTMAELADAEKDAISHRGRAARALLAWLEERVLTRRGVEARPAGAPRCSAWSPRSSWSPSSSSRGSRRARSPSSPRRRTRARTSSPRC